MITLGGIVSAPMVRPDRGVLAGVVLLVCALVLHRTMGRAGVSCSRRFEDLAHGHVTLLVKDGVILRDRLAASSFSKDLLFAALRGKGIFHLGEVARLYHEPAGALSVIRADEPQPGLSIFPPEEIAVLSRRSARFEAVTQGTLTTLITEGHYELDALRRIAISRDRLDSHLRADGILNLGQVDRMYLEIDGGFTVVRAESPVPGLSLVPPWDDELRARQKKDGDRVACAACGRTSAKGATMCECEHTQFEVAVTD